MAGVCLLRVRSSSAESWEATQLQLSPEAFVDNAITCATLIVRIATICFYLTPFCIVVSLSPKSHRYATVSCDFPKRQMDTVQIIRAGERESHVCAHGMCMMDPNEYLCPGVLLAVSSIVHYLATTSAQRLSFTLASEISGYTQSVINEIPIV